MIFFCLFFEVRLKMRLAQEFKKLEEEVERVNRTAMGGELDTATGVCRRHDLLVEFKLIWSHLCR